MHEPVKESYAVLDGYQVDPKPISINSYMFNNTEKTAIISLVWYE